MSSLISIDNISLFESVSIISSVMASSVSSETLSLLIEITSFSATSLGSYSLSIKIRGAMFSIIILLEEFLEYFFSSRKLPDISSLKNIPPLKLSNIADLSKKD